MHSVKITMIADQEIDIHEQTVNIHDIASIIVNSHGQIIEFTTYQMIEEMDEHRRKTR